MSELRKHKKKLMHISHTDIRTDSRILKAIGVGISAGFEVSAIGLETPGSGVAREGGGPTCIETMPLRSRALTWLPNGLRHLLSLLEATIRIVPAALKMKPDLIHCHDTLVLPLAVVLKSVLNCKLIYDAHELESDRNGLSKWLGRATLRCEKMLWPFIDALITVSPSIENWYVSTIGSKRSVVILNSPAHDANLRPTSRYLRDRFGISDDKTVYLYIGILGPGRGIERILDAFQKVAPTSALVFLGFGEFESSIRTVSLKKDSGVYLHPAVPHDDVVLVAASADVGLCMVEAVSLSDYFCLPNKLFEYAFAGLPVIASRFPEIARVVERYRLGVCADLDVDSIAAAMEATGRDRWRVVDQGSLYDLTWQSQAELLQALYSELSEVDASL
jgi:glycosyltransferase involved in cell wall biosynthesis